MYTFTANSCYRHVGCLHFRSIPQEHWLINEDWPRCARNYSEENQTRPLHSTRSVYHKRIVFTHDFNNRALNNAQLLSHASYMHNNIINRGYNKSSGVTAIHLNGESDPNYPRTSGITHVIGL